MPIVNGKYNAPVWVDNAPPALDASELQAISDSVASYADPFEYVPNLIRPNLLANGYFAGGGSQQGGGQFPINSRGQTSYTTNKENAIDGWSLDNYISLSLNADYVRLTGSSNNLYGYILSSIVAPENLIGKTVTVSVMCRGSNSVRTQLYNKTKNKTFARVDSSVSSSVFAVYSATHTVDSSDISAGDIVQMLIYSVNPEVGVYSQTLDVIAVKLELGDTQTLAHQENGTWVLNEIPNFDEQYMRCATLPAAPTRIEYGSYVGTGTYGSGNPSSITFGFVPKEVHIRSSSDSSTYDFDSVSGMTTTYPSRTITWSGTKMEWYSGSSSAYQMNTNGTTYYYIAFG